MCGIAGIVLPPEAAVDPTHARAMERALRHRGPDDRGFLSWPGDRAPFNVGRDAAALPAAPTWLIHRRLAIIDTGDGGRQPMCAADGRYALVFNGEIYNYPELRRELAARGHAFHTRSDTEVLLAALGEWGEEALPRLTGMFALALLDRESGHLLLARDPFGMKPLYHVPFQGGVAFASEIKALLALPGISRRADPATVREYLVRGRSDAGKATFYAAIRQVPAACAVRLATARPAEQAPSRRYWAPGAVAPFAGDETAAATALRERFVKSVRLHLRSDVPVGTALSGGVDSSAVVCGMRAELGPAAPLHGFSFVAPGAPFDEEHWIDLVGEAAACVRHKVAPADAALPGDIEAMLCAQDEPVVGTSVLAQFLVFRLVQSHGVKVTLDGQGADEYLAGYPAFAASALASRLRRGDIAAACRLFSAARADANLSGLGVAARVLPFLLSGGAGDRLRTAGAACATRAWLHPDFGQAGASPPASPHAAAMTPLKRHLCETLLDSSLPQLLRYADRNAMRFSVESRLPFLTTELVDFVLSLPDDYILRSDNTTKAVLRRAMRGIVPDAILGRRDKIGFATPQEQWLRSDPTWLDALLDQAESLPMIRRRGLRRAAAAIADGGPIPSYLWRIANLGHWAATNRVGF